MVAATGLGALQEQVGCYRRLARLAGLQHEHVQQSATESLLEVLVQRQAVLEQIAALEPTVSAARRRWVEFLDELDHAEREQAELLLAESRKLLEEIMAADQDDTLVLQQRKLNLGRQIHQASAGRQVNRSYAAAAYGKRPVNMDVQR